ncbi:MAG: PEP-CTERM sorting domain-containing protein [Phycisphaeraceae bacterium]|nr:PEP-CTERM sorting domain-containing protein [Phycisphaeraceae bacterium]
MCCITAIVFSPLGAATGPRWSFSAKSDLVSPRNAMSPIPAPNLAPARAGRQGRIAALVLAATFMGQAHVGASAATLEVTTSALARPFQFPVETASNSDERLNAGPTDLVSQFASTSTGSGDGVASAAVGLGFIPANTGASINFPGPEGGGPFADEVYRAQGSASGRYVDTVTISSPGLTGQLGTLTAIVNVSGALAMSGNTTASATWNFTKSIFGLGPTWSPAFFEQINGFRSRSRQSDGSILEFSENPSGGALIVEAAFVFGEPFQVRGQLNVVASAGQSSTTYGSAASSGLFGNTVKWPGFDEVLGPDGLPVDDFSVTSDSGFDWSGPTLVPEPGSVALLGLGGLILLTRRRSA